ncbi:MAG: hypothetical protein IJ325_13820 [Clostridia bacterium]|nr:hypothetical protein [Clostridia bacterium]
MENRENDTFHYTYSAKEQEEIKAIRQKYTPPAEEDTITKLRRLDASVTRKASALALVFGIIGALVLGCGMSLVMTELGDILGFSGEAAMFWGIGIGIVGLVLLSLAYPVYNSVLKKERERIAPEIIRLSDELIK